MTGQNTVRGLKVSPGHGVRSHPRVRPFQPVTPLTVLQGAIAPCTFILTLGGGAEMGCEFRFFSTVELNAIFKKLYETLYIVQCTMYIYKG